MNKLVLIGNGFDLAHGLPTTFDDFVKDVIKDSIQNINDSERPLLFIYVDDRDGLINLFEQKFKESQIDFGKPLLDVMQQVKSVSLVYGGIPRGVKLLYTNGFFKEMIEDSRVTGWVDFENGYYRKLLTALDLDDDRRYPNTHVADLNRQFGEVKIEFEKYITKILYQSNPKPLQGMQERFFTEHIMGKITGVDTIDSHFLSTVMVLNFNYTDLIKLYYPDSSYIYAEIDRRIELKIRQINIHGEVKNKENPIIFGYGDESDKRYGEIEDKNDNSLLEHFKASQYTFTENYHKLENFVGNGEFVVEIIGHSCGLSDRVLLKYIFESENCKGITIVHYENAQHHGEIYNNILRCFSMDKKGEVRSKVIPFRKENRCPQYTD